MKRASLFIVTFLAVSCIFYEVSAMWSGAGVIPCSINPQNGRIMALLGIDHHRTNKGVTGGPVYTDLGGKKDKADKNAAFTAAREGSEESADAFGSRHALYGLTSKLNSHYILVNPKNGYTLYFISVPFVSAHKITNTPGKGHKEKISYAWIYISDLAAALSHSNGIHRISVSDRYGTKQCELYDFLAQTLKTPSLNGTDPVSYMATHNTLPS